jgi:hypothetical protein
MKKLVLGALLAVAASTAACTSSASTEAVITADWPFRHVDGTASGQCDPNFGTAAIYSQPWDPVSNNLLGQPVIDKFNCSAMHGTTDPLDGIFLVWVQIESDDATRVYVTSESTYVDTADGDVSLHFPILDDGGYFFLTWDLVNAQTQAPLTCAQAGIGSNGSVETVVSIVPEDPTMDPIVDKFTCSHGFGTTDPIPEGTYTVVVDANNNSGAAVGTAPALNNKVIRAPGGLTDLGHILIPITP